MLSASVGVADILSLADLLLYFKLLTVNILFNFKLKWTGTTFKSIVLAPVLDKTQMIPNPIHHPGPLLIKLSTPALIREAFGKGCQLNPVMLVPKFLHATLS